MTYKIFARLDKKSKKGTPLVFIIQPGDFKISLQLHCKEGSWDQDRQMVRVTGLNKDPNGSKINSLINKARVKLETAIAEGRNITEIRAIFSKEKEEKKQADLTTVKIPNLNEYEELTIQGKLFYILIEKMINAHKSDWSESHKTRLRVARSKILKFDHNFDPYRYNMETFEQWWRDYSTWCIEKRDNVSSTIGADAEIIRAIMNEIGIRVKIKWKSRSSEIYGLSWDKILKIADYKHDNPFMVDTAIIFTASAFTGRRWSEISTIGPENFIENGTRYKNVGKGQKVVDIRLLPEAVEFFRNVNYRMPKIANNTVNINIKLICKDLGFNDRHLIITPIDANRSKSETFYEWEMVHFHTARHSFAQRIIDLATKKQITGIDKFVSAMLGHSSYQTTWRYLNRTKGSIDEAFDKIIGD